MPYYLPREISHAILVAVEHVSVSNVPDDEEHTSQPCHFRSLCSLVMWSCRYLIHIPGCRAHRPAAPSFKPTNWAGGELHHQGQQSFLCRAWNTGGEVRGRVSVPAERGCAAEGLEVKDQVCRLTQSLQRGNATDKHISVAANSYCHKHTHSLSFSYGEYIVAEHCIIVTLLWTLKVKV